MKKICIIGFGNMGSYLAAGLVGDKRFQLQIFSSHEFDLRAERISKIEDIDAATDLIFLAVPDDAVIKLASQLSFLHEATIIHCSGTLGISHGAQQLCCLWPIYSIKKELLPQHREVPIVLCAKNNQALHALRYIASIFTNQIFELSEDQKSAAHLMAVMTNNYMTHLAAATEQFAHSQNIPFSLVQPIIAQTFDNIKNSKAASSQTGPAIRRDAATIKKHLELLAENSALKHLYLSFVKSIQNLNP